MRHVSGSVLLALIVISGIALSAVGYVSTAQQPSVPNEWGEVPYCVGVVKYPNWGFPDIAWPGGNATIHLWGGVTVSGVTIENTTFKGQLKLITSTGSEAVVKLPEGLGPGTYDLVLKTSKGVCGIHNAIWVPSSKYSSPKDAIVFMHVTDEHFNVINPGGRPAEDYVLSAILLALSMPNVTMVVSTGDLANTGMVSQYLRAIEVFGLLNKPVLSAPGNHDHVSGIRNYEMLVGPTNWSVRVGRFLFTAIDTGYDGYPTTAEADWLYKVLTGSNASVEILMFHHPLFSYVYGNTPHSFNVSSWEDLEKILLSKKPGSKYPYLYTSWLQNRKAFEEVVKAIYGSRTALVLAGHIHLDSYAVIERPNHFKTVFVVTTALGGPVRKQDYHGFRIIKVYGNGTVKVYGEGKPWDRHASYSVEGVKAYLRVSAAASAESLTITDPKIASMLPHIVLAVPIPKSFEGKYKVYAPGAQRTWSRCTQVFCALYAEFSKVKLGKTYRLAAYVKPDEAPPTITLKEAPKEVLVGSPINIYYTLSDDAWGIQSTNATVIINGKEEHVNPMLYGGMYLVSFLAPKTPGKVTVKITATDLSGKVASKTVTINVVKQATTTTTPETTSTTKSVTTPTTTTVTTRTKTATTPTSTPPPTSTTSTTTTTSTSTSATATPASPTVTSATTPVPQTPPTTVIVAGVIAVIVVAVIIYLVLRRAGGS